MQIPRLVHWDTRWVCVQSGSTLMSLITWTTINPIRHGGEGTQGPGWPNSQLPFKNLLLYDAQSLWLLVFTIKTCSDEILAKLVNHGSCCCFFLIETFQKFWEWKNFRLLENCWGVNFEWKRTNLEIKAFFRLNPFSGAKYPYSMTLSILQILWCHISKTGKAIRLRFKFGMLL